MKRSRREGVWGGSAPAASLRRAASVAPLTLMLACALGGPSASPLESLALSVAELELHLRDDPYRSDGSRVEAGREFFAEMRWRLERAQRERGRAPAQWERDDVILELARARTLERLREYGAAAQAYDQVGERAPDLRIMAEACEARMRRFALRARPLGEVAEADGALLGEIEQRIEAWSALAREEPAPYDSLALAEAETWEVLRVETLAHEGLSSAAIAACERLLQHHRESRRLPRHLLRLGDLHADAARRAQLWARAGAATLAESGYPQDVESALSAYERAIELHDPAIRRDAERRIQLLLALQERVISGAD